MSGRLGLTHTRDCVLNGGGGQLLHSTGSSETRCRRDGAGGRETRGRGVCTLTADSLCRAAETSTSLESNYTPIETLCF